MNDLSFNLKSRKKLKCKLKKNVNSKKVEGRKQKKEQKIIFKISEVIIAAICIKPKGTSVKGLINQICLWQENKCKKV